jgi:2-hydroxychromene-2-carboxylate isomerase
VTEPVDLYWSFRSPYCYIGVDRIVALAAAFDVTLTLRVVMPLAIREPEYFQSLPPTRFSYLSMDTVRVADSLGLAFARPEPDPVVFDTGVRRASDDQPYIHWLSRLGIAAQRRGRGREFAREVAHLLWDGRTKGWDTGQHLAEATARAGLDLAQMDAEIAADTAAFDAQIAADGDQLCAIGQWGVPTLGVRGEPFFGQDRIDLFAWRLRELGIAGPPA